MEIKQGERYLIVANDYGEKTLLDEIVIVELHDKFAKVQIMDIGKTEWRYVTDLETDIVAHLPSLPGQHVRFGKPLHEETVTSPIIVGGHLLEPGETIAEVLERMERKA